MIKTDVTLNRSFVCPHPWKSVLVTITGDVYPCCFNTLQGPFGNIHNDSLEKIWNGERFVKLRKQWATKTIKNSGCENCRLLTMTKGDVLFRQQENQSPGSIAAINFSKARHEFEQRASVLSAMPFNITYFPSTHCNLSCIFCGQNNCGIQDLGMIGYKMLCNLTPYLKSITWLGGEPIMQPQLKKWIEEFDTFNNHDIEIGIITNASFFGEKLVKLLPQIKALRINISFDSHIATLYEELRRKGNFEQTLENIDRYISLRGQSNEITVNLNFLWQKKNFITLPDYLRFCCARKVYALINPLDQWPVPMRLDIFEKLENDLPTNYEKILSEALKEARHLDTVLRNKKHLKMVDRTLGMPGQTEPYVKYCIEIIQKGIIRHLTLNKEYTGALAPGINGRYVYALAADGLPMAYGAVNSNGFFSVRYKNKPGTCFVVHKDIYGNLYHLSSEEVLELSAANTFAVWGAGNTYFQRISPLVKNGMFENSIRYIVDNSPKKQQGKIDGISVTSAEELKKTPVDIIVITSFAFATILSQIQSLALAYPVLVLSMRHLLITNNNQTIS